MGGPDRGRFIPGALGLAVGVDAASGPHGVARVSSGPFDMGLAPDCVTATGWRLCKSEC